MPECNNCDRFVTKRYVRVFGLDGEIANCSHCQTNAMIYKGGGLPDGHRGRNFDEDRYE